MHNDEGKTREQLLAELAELRQRVAELETTEPERKRAKVWIGRLNRLQEDLLGPRGLDEKLKHITDGVVEIFDADFARVWITKPGDRCDSGCFHARVTEGPHICRHRDRCLHLIASSGRYTHIDGEVHRRVPFGCYKIGRVAAGEDPKFITNDVTHDPRVHDHGWAGKLGLVSFAGYRLLSATEKPIGVLALFSKHAVTPDEDALLEGLANTTAQVIQTVRAEEALREGEEKYRQLFELESDATFLIDNETGRILEANAASSALYGYSREELLQKKNTDLSAEPDETHRAVAEQWTRVPVRFHRKKGGTVFPVEITGRHFTWRGREVHIAAIRDITERVQAEEELRESRWKLDQMLQTMMDGMIVVDQAGQITYANRAAEWILETHEDNIVGRDHHDGEWRYVDEQGASYPLEQLPLAIALREQRAVEGLEHGLISPYGEVKWLSVNATPLFDERGQLFGAVASFRDITEHKQAEAALQQRTAQLEALRQVGLEITAQLDLDALLHSIVSRAIELLGGNAGGLYLYKPEQDVLEWTVAIGPDVAPAGTVLHRGEGLSGKILETAEPIIIDDYQYWEGQSTAWEGYSTLAVIGVPVRWGEEFLGVLNVRADPPYTFSSADADLLSLFATQAAIAIRNARLYDEARSRAERLAVVNRIAKAAGATLHLDDLMEAVYQEIAPAFQADAFFIALYDEEADELSFPFWVDEEVPTPPARKPLGTGLTSRIISEKKPLIIRDKQKLDRLLPSTGLFVPEVKLAASWLGVPMLVGERVVGVISVQAHRSHAWDEEDELLLFTIADQVAVALESVRLFEEARIRAEELAVLNELGQALTARLDVEEVLKEARRQAARLVDTTNFYIGLYDPAKDEITFPLNISGSELDDSITVLAADQSITGYVIHNRKSVLLEENIPEWLEEMGVELIGQDTASWLGVPLMIGDQVLGAIVVQSYTPSHLYDEHDRDLLTAIAAQASIAIQNARLFEMERRRTSQLAAVARVAGQITSILNLNDLLRETVELITQAFGYYYAAIMLLDTEADELVFKVGAGGYAGWTPVGFRQKVKEGMIGWAAHLGETILANDIDQEPRHIPAYLTETRSELDVPLKYHDRVIGVLDLQSKELNAFSPHDVIAMETLASHVAAAIENARLYEQAQHEIAERKQAEEALRTAYEERRQAQAQLVQSAKMAAVGRLAAGVAHEINNPLTGILGFAELLLRNAAPDDPNRERLNIIAHEARRVRDIVRALLNFSRQTTPHREMVQVNQILLDTLVLVRQSLEKNGVAIKEHYAPDLPSLWLDVGQMRQVVLNLVTNAINAMPQGGTLTVTSERAGNEVAVRIADTGGGIPAEDLLRIFDPFFTTRPVGQGTGLGLSISLGIVQEHGGRIEAESREGVGSTFTVWLPVEIMDETTRGVS